MKNLYSTDKKNDTATRTPYARIQTLDTGRNIKDEKNSHSNRKAPIKQIPYHVRRKSQERNIFRHECKIVYRGIKRLPRNKASVHTIAITPT